MSEEFKPIVLRAYSLPFLCPVTPEQVLAFWPRIGYMPREAYEAAIGRWEDDGGRTAPEGNH